jgi:hypothetical protein
VTGTLRVDELLDPGPTGVVTGTLMVEELVIVTTEVELGTTGEEEVIVTVETVGEQGTVVVTVVRMLVVYVLV